MKSPVLSQLTQAQSPIDSDTQQDVDYHHCSPPPSLHHHHNRRIRTHWMLQTMGVCCLALTTTITTTALQPQRQRPHVKPMRNGKTSLDYVLSPSHVYSSSSTTSSTTAKPTVVKKQVNNEFLLMDAPIPLKTTTTKKSRSNHHHKPATKTTNNNQKQRRVQPATLSSALPLRRGRRTTTPSTPPTTTTARARAESAYQLQAAEKHPPAAALLTKDEEIALAHQIRALRRIEQIRDDQLLQWAAAQDHHAEDETTNTNHLLTPIPHMTESQWAAACGMSTKQLHRMVHAGHHARSQLALGNVGLVTAIAKRYHGSLQRAQPASSVGTILSLQDIVQEGQLGLMEAAERFDPERGVRFSTYATWWIRQRIVRSISDSSRIIRLPAHVHSMLTKIDKAKHEMKRVMTGGREPSTQELAQYLDIPEEKLHRYYESRRNVVVSLENPLRANGGNLMKADDTRTIGDTIASDAPTPLEDAQQTSLQQELRQVMQDSLALPERQVLVARYGLEDGRCKSLQETSRVLGVSRERVRLLEARALNKLRHPQRKYRLKTYMGGAASTDGNDQDGRRVVSPKPKATKNPYAMLRDNPKQQQQQRAATATTNPFQSGSSSSFSPFTGFSSSFGGAKFHDDYESSSPSSSTSSSRKNAKTEETEALSGKLWFF